MESIRWWWWWQWQWRWWQSKNIDYSDNDDDDDKWNAWPAVLHLSLCTICKMREPYQPQPGVQTFEFLNKNQRPTFEREKKSCVNICQTKWDIHGMRMWGEKDICVRVCAAFPFKDKLCQVTLSRDTLRVRMKRKPRWANEWALDRYKWKQRADNNSNKCFSAPNRKYQTGNLQLENKIGHNV